MILRATGPQLLLAVPESVISGTTATGGVRPGQHVPETSPGTACRNARYRDGIRDDRHHDHRARVRQQRPHRLRPGLHPGQERQAQLDALATAHCREIIVETASTRSRPKLREALGQLQAGDTLVIYKPDRVARSMKELLVLLEDQRAWWSRNGTAGSPART